ncbi:MAG: NADPH-dependent oxidoreductase [Anaerolineales bacterium]|jgi:FMN reductase (NADPH)
MRTPAIELMHRHGSVRSYKTDPVPRELVDQIVIAGQRASTSSNLQTYCVVATTDPVKKEKLMEISGGQHHIAQAPVILLWCADFKRLEQVCSLQGYVLEAGYLENFLVASIDAAIASQNSALAAESLGLGICYLGALRNNPRELEEIFQLPKLVYPLFGMTVGWPNKSPMIRPRLPLGAVLSWEQYQESSLEDLEEYDQAMIDTGIYRGRQVDRQDQDPELYGWLEHSARRVSKPRRPELLETVLECGFTLK